MTKFKHKETGCKRMLARIPFGAIMFVTMMSFALVGGVHSEENPYADVPLAPIEAYGMTWDADLLTEFEELAASADKVLAQLEKEVRATAPEADADRIIEGIRILGRVMAKGAAIYAITTAVNEVGDAMCEPIPEPETDEGSYDNFEETATRFFSASL